MSDEVGGPATSPNRNNVSDASLDFEAVLECAELDDEPFTAADRAASDRGWREHLGGESLSLEEAHARRGARPGRAPNER